MKQLTLGELIEKLSKMPRKQRIVEFTSPHSYRGYPADLAFEQTDFGCFYAEEALELCKSCLGASFEGWKSGNYTMGENTLVWMAFHGETGPQLVDIEEDGSLLLRAKLA